MNILVIDDSALWINEAQRLLTPKGHLVSGYRVEDSKRFTSQSLPDDLVDALLGAELVLIDRDFGEGVTSTRLLCVLRHHRPTLPIIRWSGANEWKLPQPLKLLGISVIDKPTRHTEREFGAKFDEAVAEQQLLQSGPLGIFATLPETTDPDENQRKTRENRLTQLEQIAQLAYVNIVDSANPQYPWKTSGKEAGTTKHELGHCICDGDLTATDIAPFMEDLKKVIAKFRANGEIDDRFATCAEFLEKGNIDELELIRRCY